ncbi:MAG: 3-hydroxyacyl-CoA dehydrogenase NAD-binding domain-containing protein [Clostridia bacterium]
MKLAIIGNGIMANGIGQVFAQNGHTVVFKGRTEDKLAKAIATIDKGLARLVSRDRMTAEVKDATMALISTTTDFADLADADLIIEAVAEDMAIKHETFKILDGICKEDAIFATNTSSLSITEIASVLKNPSRLIGLHFFNPVPMMKLVEIICGQLTCPKITEQTTELMKEIGKVPVKVAEAPGFVVNRILIPLVNEGVGILAEGIATAEDIDNAMKLGANHPMGPLALGDLIGLDVCLAIMDVLYKETGDSKYRAHSLLRKKVRAGQLGRKTGVGFFDYTK